MRSILKALCLIKFPKCQWFYMSLETRVDLTYHFENTLETPEETYQNNIHIYNINDQYTNYSLFKIRFHRCSPYLFKCNKKLSNLVLFNFLFLKMCLDASSKKDLKILNQIRQLFITKKYGEHRLNPRNTKRPTSEFS